MPGCGPADIDVAQVYENFTGMVLLALEDLVFCPRGEGGPFVKDGKLAGPAGALPHNTAGGNLAEAYVHGLNTEREVVRQMRGGSTCQVRDTELCLVAGGTGAPTTSALAVRVPYNVALVELPDAGGVRLVSNVIDVQPGELHVGLAVEVVFEDLEDVTLPRFRPARCAG